MLLRLSISNYTLIEHLEVDLQQGFTAITGETGSGKSIILGALGLLLGNRAEGNLLRDPERKCIIEALWDTSRPDLKAFLQAQDLDVENESVLRREITPSGKSRLFFNDTPVNASIMREFRELAIDIHSQLEHSSLRNSQAQLAILDAFALQEKEVNIYREDYRNFLQIQKKLEGLKEEQTQRERDKDYQTFQLKELEEAELSKLVGRNLDAELQTLSHAEEIRSQLHQAAQLFDSGEHSATSSIQQINELLDQVSRLSPEMEELRERMKSLSIEWSDLEREIGNKAEGVEVDEEKLSILRDQHEGLNKLLFKHNKQSAEELLLLEESLADEANDTEGINKKIEELSKSLTESLTCLTEQAEAITKKRALAGKEVDENIRKTLAQLSMPHAEVCIQLESLKELGPAGLDKVQFLFKTNKGSDFGSLDKVASGGELSRMMLALKGAIAQKKALPVLIFDEIDTGVSGEVAHKMGALMREMSQSQQLVVITHLPQIAGKAHHHWRVSKEDSGFKTASHMQVLSQEERVTEIATMISGDQLTDAAMEQARVLLGDS